MLIHAKTKRYYVILYTSKTKGNIPNVSKKTVVITKRVIFNISATLLDSNKFILWDNQTTLSTYNLTTESKTNLSLKRKPVYITKRLIQISAVFFWRKSKRNPSFQINSFRL